MECFLVFKVGPNYNVFCVVIFSSRKLRTMFFLQYMSMKYILVCIHEEGPNGTWIPVNSTNFGPYTETCFYIGPEFSTCRGAHSFSDV